MFPPGPDEGAASGWGSNPGAGLGTEGVSSGLSEWPWRHRRLLLRTFATTNVIAAIAVTIHMGRKIDQIRAMAPTNMAT